MIEYNLMGQKIELPPMQQTRLSESHFPYFYTSAIESAEQIFDYFNGPSSKLKILRILDSRFKGLDSPVLDMINSSPQYLEFSAFDWNNQLLGHGAYLISQNYPDENFSENDKEFLGWLIRTSPLNKYRPLFPDENQLRPFRVPPTEQHPEDAYQYYEARLTRIVSDFCTSGIVSDIKPGRIIHHTPEFFSAAQYKAVKLIDDLLHSFKDPVPILDLLAEHMFLADILDQRSEQIGICQTDWNRLIIENAYAELNSRE